MKYEETMLKKYCSNGDIPGLIAYLKTCPNQEELISFYEKIFIQEPSEFQFPTENKKINNILKGYYHYYVYVFGKGHTPEEGKQFLYETFKKLYPYPWLRNINLMEIFIKMQINREGYHYLGGTTSSFYGPYIWKETEKKVYDVEIPEGIIKVKVFFMKDFIANSWLSFISKGKTGTGGWTKRRGLFCKWDSYSEKLDHPSFQISFLKHEAQHLSDFRKYHRKLSVSQLEYRAKLTELSYYPVIDLFESFLSTAKNDANYSHSQAAYWIVEDLSNKFFKENYVTDLERWKNVYYMVPDQCKKMLLEESRIK